MKEKRSFLYLAKFHKLDAYTVAELANHAYTKEFLRNKENVEECEIMDHLELAQNITLNFDLGKTVFDLKLKDRHGTPLTIYLNKKGRIDKVDVTEYNKVYGEETAQWIACQPGTKTDVIICKNEKLSDAEILAVLKNFAEQKQPNAKPPVSVSSMSAQIDEFIEEYNKIGSPIPIFNFQQAIYLRDPNCTTIKYSFSDDLYQDHPKERVTEIDVTEFNKVYGKDAARQAINEYISETTQKLEK